MTETCFVCDRSEKMSKVWINGVGETAVCSTHLDKDAMYEMKNGKLYPDEFYPKEGSLYPEEKDRKKSDF